MTRYSADHGEPALKRLLMCVVQTRDSIIRTHVTLSTCAEQVGPRVSGQQHSFGDDAPENREINHAAAWKRPKIEKMREVVAYLRRTQMA